MTETKKSMVAIAVVLDLLLVASACGGGGQAPAPTPTPTAIPTSTPTPAYETYTDVVNGFSIEYPQGWNKYPEEYMEEEILIGYGDSSRCDGILSNFNVGQEKLLVSMSVQDFWEEVKQQLATLEGYAPISEEEITIYGLPAIKHVYIFMYQGEPLKNAQAFLVEGKTAWGIICTSAPNCWSQYESTFDTIINSFKLLD